MLKGPNQVLVKDIRIIRMKLQHLDLKYVLQRHMKKHLTQPKEMHVHRWDSTIAIPDNCARN